MSTPGALPDGYYQMTLHGLPGHPKTIAGLEGRDIETGEMWQSSVWVNPEHPVDSLPVLIPYSVPFTRVISADEMLDEVLDEVPDALFQHDVLT